MKIKDLIEILEEENPKAKIIFDFDGNELEIDEWGTESSDHVVTIRLIDNN